MKLEDLLSSLEKQAGFTPEDSKKEKEKVKEDEKKAKTDPKSDLEKAEEGDGGKDVEDGHDKSASFKSGSKLAKEIMEKVASTTINNTQGEQMNKSASEAGKALAQALMEKLAATGDVNTVNGIPEGVVPNKTQVDLAAQVAEHDAIIQPTPMGMVPGQPAGTINQIFDAIVADANQGAVSAVLQTPTAPMEGALNGRQAPNQEGVSAFVGAENEGQEKAAAVSALVDGGIDFDDAVALVKRASDELEAEEEILVKQAAFNELMAQGYAFEDAVAMVKSAGAIDIGREKQAAVSELMSHGVDFDTAVDLVNAKAQEIYG